MGQYYKVVNLSKRQFMNPHDFGDSGKLLEFGTSSFGIMNGLAILLASGNGRGGGDLYTSGTTKELGKLKPHQMVDHSYEISNEKGVKIPHEIRVPKIAGSWAGDQIVIAGDYANPNLFGVEANKKSLFMKTVGMDNKKIKFETKPENQNLYFLIKYDQSRPKKNQKWTNISKDVIQAMRENSLLKDELKKRMEWMG